MTPEQILNELKTVGHEVSKQEQKVRVALANLLAYSVPENLQRYTIDRLKVKLNHHD